MNNLSSKFAYESTVVSSYVAPYNKTKRKVEPRLEAIIDSDPNSYLPKREYKNENCNVINYPVVTQKEPINIQFYGYNVQLPIKLENIAQCLHKSEKILELKEDWDDAGSEGFTQETWLGVVQFLTSYAKQLDLEFRRCIDIPKIFPSAKGSIDIDWETDSYGLLINITKGGKHATYYADDKNHQITEGVFDPRSFDVRLLPLAIAINTLNKE